MTSVWILSRSTSDSSLASDKHALLAAGAGEVVGAVAGAGVLERGAAVHPLRPGREVDAHVAVVVGRVLVVLDGRVDVDDDAADGVDQPLEAAEVDARVILDGDAEVGADGLHGQLGPAHGVSDVDTLLAANAALARAAARDGDPHVARQRDERRRL